MSASAEKAIRIPESDQSPDINAGSLAAERRDWSASLNLIHRAGVSLRDAEDQTQKLVTRAQVILERANQELETAYEGIAAAEERAQAAEERAERAETLLKEAEARAELAESRAKEAEGRAELAEARATAAEEWLGRIHEAILDEFAPGSAPGDQENVLRETGGIASSVERGSDIIRMRQPVAERRLRAV